MSHITPLSLMSPRSINFRRVTKRSLFFPARHKAVSVLSVGGETILNSKIQGEREEKRNVASGVPRRADVP